MADTSKFRIEVRNGDPIVLDKQTVVKYITNGQDISDSEFTTFFQLCKAHKVNPFLKEAYIIKYGNQPATIVLDYKVLQMCAESNPNYAGMKTGVIVVNQSGNAIEREGSYVLPNETLVAGWCEVRRKDRDVSTKVYSMINEFIQTKKDGTVNSNWSGKPTFMITKVAKAQALREAFPNMFGANVYSSEEAETFEEKANERKYDNTDVVDAVVREHSQDEELANPFDEMELGE